MGTQWTPASARSDALHELAGYLCVYVQGITAKLLFLCVIMIHQGIFKGAKKLARLIDNIPCRSLVSPGIIRLIIDLKILTYYTLSLPRDNDMTMIK